jgi:hypothetical protein
MPSKGDPLLPEFMSISGYASVHTTMRFEPYAQEENAVAY